MGKQAYKNNLIESRKKLPAKYQKFIEKSNGNSDINALVKVCYNIRWFYFMEDSKFYKVQKPQWFRMINIHPSCNDSAAVVAKNYGGKILDSRKVEVELEEFERSTYSRKLSVEEVETYLQKKGQKDFNK